MNLAADPGPDAFTTSAITDLNAVLVRVDAHGGHALAAIHIQWAIELLRGEAPGAGPGPDGPEAG